MDGSERLKDILGFLQTCDRFKSVRRGAYLADGSRHETDAEHAWHMSLFALLLQREARFPLDSGRVLELIALHDLVEIEAGDTFAHDAAGRRGKRAREEAAADRLFAQLPGDLRERVRGRWDEYEAGQTLETRFARAIDKLQACAQNVFAGGRVWRERGVTERMSRAYNRDAMALDPSLAAAFEALYQRASREQLWSPERATG
jgi:putative hydrolase of HD superfamily